MKRPSEKLYTFSFFILSSYLQKGKNIEGTYGKTELFELCE